MTVAAWHGVLLLDKPAGMTSFDVVAQVRRRLGVKQVGHAGTLDPLATGLLLILVGEATKLSQYFTLEDKSYEVTLRLGARSTTLDADGEITPGSPWLGDPREVQAVGLALQGEVDLLVPAFSAKKVDGERLYEKAYRGEIVDRPRKKMTFTKVEFCGFEQDLYRFNIACEKGGFIRSWVEELGERLGVGAYVKQLRRTKSGGFHVGSALPLNALTPASAQSALLPMRSLLPDWPTVYCSLSERSLLNHGQISHSLRAQLIRIFQPGVSPGVLVIDPQTDLCLALVACEPEKGFRIRRVFQY